jgi:hypothetical protein
MGGKRQKRPPNWFAIQKRYLANEPPSEIEKDYEVTAKAIRNKAYREDWKEQRETIKDSIVTDVADELKALCRITIRVHRRFMEKLDGMDDEITNPYLFDGEKTNSLFQTAMNNAVKLVQSALKDSDPAEPEEPPGFHVVQDDAQG